MRRRTSVRYGSGRTSSGPIGAGSLARQVRREPPAFSGVLPISSGSRPESYTARAPVPIVSGPSAHNVRRRGSLPSLWGPEHKPGRRPRSRWAVDGGGPAPFQAFGVPNTSPAVDRAAAGPSTPSLWGPEHKPGRRPRSRWAVDGGGPAPFQAFRGPEHKPGRRPRSRWAVDPPSLWGPEHKPGRRPRSRWAVDGGGPAPFQAFGVPNTSPAVDRAAAGPSTAGALLPSKPLGSRTQARPSTAQPLGRRRRGPCSLPSLWGPEHKPGRRPRSRWAVDGGGPRGNRGFTPPSAPPPKPFGSQTQSRAVDRAAAGPSMAGPPPSKPFGSQTRTPLVGRVETGPSTCRPGLLGGKHNALGTGRAVATGRGSGVGTRDERAGGRPWCRESITRRCGGAWREVSRAAGARPLVSRKNRA